MSRLTHFDQRRRRVRTAIARNSGGRPRLSVHRSSQHIYAQIIDDTNGVTLAAASTLEKGVRGTTGATTGAAAAVGSAWPSGPRRPVFRLLCSTVAVFSSMAA